MIDLAESRATLEAGDDHCPLTVVAVCRGYSTSDDGTGFGLAIVDQIV